MDKSTQKQDLTILWGGELFADKKRFDAERGCWSICDSANRKKSARGHFDYLYFFVRSISLGYMKDHEFEKEDLVKLIMEHYIGVTEEKASADIDKFLKLLADHNVMDNGQIQGGTFFRVPKEALDQLWPIKKTKEDKEEDPS